jgi:hypothetical protein
MTIHAFIGDYVRQAEMVIVRPAAGAPIAGKAHAGAAPDVRRVREEDRGVAIVRRLRVTRVSRAR